LEWLVEDRTVEGGAEPAVVLLFRIFGSVPDLEELSHIEVQLKEGREWSFCMRSNSLRANLILSFFPLFFCVQSLMAAADVLGDGIGRHEHGRGRRTSSTGAPTQSCSY
jgi:hypothetical protein